MNTIANFEIVGRRGFYRPVGKVSFDEGVELVAQAMRHARTKGLTSLLIDSRGFSGFAPPSIFDRHSLATKWAEAAGTGIMVALIARPELVDPQKIGVLMVQNRGVTGDVFDNELAAISWLDTRDPDKARHDLK